MIYEKLRAIIALMRLDKPVGIFLLWFPIAWALCLAYPKWPPISITIWFALGTLTMRSAGCVINDIADRNWDGLVDRTQNRPLACGQISLPQALIVFILLMCLALVILVQLPKNCFYGALPAAFLTMLYPFCKRYLATPQLVLGLAFACGIPMVALASHSHWNLSWTLLMLITILWVLAYDTQYALADIEDDKQVGILSSARFFGKYVYLMIFLLQLSMHGLWIFYGLILKLDWSWYIGWTLALAFGIHQKRLLLQNKPLQAFKNNTWYGLYMWLLLLLSKIV